MHPPYCALQRKLTPSPTLHHPLASPHIISGPVHHSYLFSLENTATHSTIPSPLTPHLSSLIPHSSSLTPHPSSLIPHPSPLTPHPSPLTPHPSPLTHSSLLTAFPQVLISCPFWLINDTGLPLVFKQDQSPHDFANQFSEHERASNRQPLLFSYSDVDQSDLCTVRLGKETHSSGSPRWCSSFSMVRGTSFVRLFWKCDGGRPER